MTRPQRDRTFLIFLGAAAAAGAAVAVVRHLRSAAMGRKVAGGILIGDAASYDALSHRLLLGSLFGRIAADVAAVARTARGCSRSVADPAACPSGWPASTAST
jgi:hypothetical protein